jgi:hypothetical protein
MEEIQIRYREVDGRYERPKGDRRRSGMRRTGGIWTIHGKYGEI